MSTSWPRRELGDLVDHNRKIAYGVLKPGEEDPTGVPLIRAMDLKDGRVLTAELRTITQELSDQYRRTILKGGELLMTLVGTPGEVALVPDFLAGANVNRATGVIPLNDSVCHRYVMYYLRSPTGRNQVLARLTGAVQVVLNLGDLRTLSIPTPPIEVQEAIAGVLGSIDDLIENNRRRIEVLEEMAQAIYREWFVHFRFPGHEDATFVDSPLGPIPEGWKVQPFSEIATFTNGFAFKPSHWSSSGRPIIKIKELKNGVAAETPRCTETEIPEKYWIEPGDLLFSWSADLCVHRWSGEPGLLNQHLFAVAPATEVSSLYIQHALTGALPKFWDRAQGTTMRHIKRSALNEVTTVVPAAAVETQFRARVSSIGGLGLRLVQTNRELTEIRDLLLPKLVTGEIDVSCLDLDALIGAAS